jgi:uncharacterized protein
MMKPAQRVIKLDFASIPKRKIQRYLFDIAGDGLGDPITIPVFALSSEKKGPVVCVTAAVHGNEINGVRVIQRLFREVDMKSFTGTLIGVPVVNVPAFLQGVRSFDQRADMNHVMPGEERGNMTQIYAHRFFTRIISQCEYLIDLHTASFGRVNSYYVRADMTNPTVRKMAQLLNPEIILHNKGASGTLRSAASQKGIFAVTAELRDPYKFQKKIIFDSLTGVKNILSHLGMQNIPIIGPREKPIICEKSYWMYTDQGGLLTVVPSVLTQVKEGEIIARVRNIFGDILREYSASQSGIVIGKSINPVNQTGSRILHLGILRQK